jgi:hypothetical protein
MDIGTGAGVPGLIIAVDRPDLTCMSFAYGKDTSVKPLNRHSVDISQLAPATAACTSSGDEI